MRQEGGSIAKGATAKVMSVRKRLLKSETLATSLAGLAGRYLAFCHKTTQWDYEGLDDLKGALAEGPILLLTWHSRSIMGSLHWPTETAPLSSLYANSPIGRVSGAVQRRAGLQAIEMSSKASNRAASREILKRVKDGVSIGMTGDGPLGPAKVLNDASLEWARVTGMPIFCYSFATTKGRRVNSWDEMLVPKPFGKGACIFRRFDQTVARKIDPATAARLRQDLQAFMTQTTADADHALGLAPGP
jgi:lysophospholipid acyltransferase (LPLAT)-like uncharacterized protein